MNGETFTISRMSLHNKQQCIRKQTANNEKAKRDVPYTTALWINTYQQY